MKWVELGIPTTLPNGVPITSKWRGFQQMGDLVHKKPGRPHWAGKHGVLYIYIMSLFFISKCTFNCSNFIYVLIDTVCACDDVIVTVALFWKPCSNLCNSLPSGYKARWTAGD